MSTTNHVENVDDEQNTYTQGNAFENILHQQTATVKNSSRIHQNNSQYSDWSQSYSIPPKGNQFQGDKLERKWRLISSCNQDTVGNQLANIGHHKTSITTVTSDGSGPVTAKVTTKGVVGSSPPVTATTSVTSTCSTASMPIPPRAPNSQQKLIPTPPPKTSSSPNEKNSRSKIEQAPYISTQTSEKLTTVHPTPPPLPLRPPAVPKRSHVTYASEKPVNGLSQSQARKDLRSSCHSTSSPQRNVRPPSQLPHQSHKTGRILPSIPIKSRLPPQSPPICDKSQSQFNILIANSIPASLLDSSTLAKTHLFNNSKNYSDLHTSSGCSSTVDSGGFPSGMSSSSAASKLPPLSPIATDRNALSKSTSNGKISIRQDSNVSSDSFSQTSSPSYTTKTMEAPLLPNSSRNHYNGNICGQPTSVTAKKDKNKPDEAMTNGSSITKSVSTPASLQTIVRFHNGSNMSLHHRIIRDMRRPSSHYAGGIRFRFRFAQILINAVALLAISAGLAAYFKAYPTSIKLVITNVTSKSESTTTSSNPAPGICLPVIVNFCLNHKVPYNFTVFPNYMGHFSQRDAQQELEVYDAVVDVRCYELAALFLCSVFVPKCGHTGQVVRPCRSLCFETKRRCGFFLDVFGLPLPDYLECGLFPESTDPEICVGHKEVKEAKLRAQKPACTAGFKCDLKRCIPADWQCDGHVDCKDQSDELNCKQCAKGMIHCGEEHCMSQEHMCDGIVDCPWGQDERNCLRLSDANGNDGHGQLEVFLPEQQQWVPACVSRWDPEHSAHEVCSLLGYTAANWSHSSPSVADVDISPPVRENTSPWRNIFKSKVNLIKEFRSCAGNTHQSVNLTCTKYACGKIRKTYREKARKRIVGGIESAPGDWPFLAALLGGPEEVFYCAGVLISDQWILTASHCVGNAVDASHSDVSGWTIQLGITRRHSHTYYGQKMKVRRVVPHPMYNLDVAHDNDVALFQLTNRVTFHEHLLPVCLPPSNKELLPGTVCTVIGWGKREDKGMSEYEPAVNEVQVPVLNRDLCNSWLQHRDLNVTEGMICAGYPEGGKDACQGDSGGPLLCRDDDDPDRWFVGGIVSWGIKCAHPQLPGVYAYVPKYIPWIQKQIALYSD